MKHLIEVEPRSAINPAQKSRLEVLEHKIKVGLKNYEAMGQALAEIKRDGLYQLRGCDDFGEYCDKLGISRSHADRLVEAANAHRVIAPLGVTKVSERAMRPLFWLKPEKQTAVWKEVLKETKDPKAITGKLVNEVKGRVLNERRVSRPITVKRRELVADLQQWYDETTKLHKLAGKALLCEIVAFIRRYE